MPIAAFCMTCNEYSWVAPDGGCSQGHRRSQLRALYEAAPTSGRLVPPPPARPDGKPARGGEQVDMRPGATYGKG